MNQSARYGSEIDLIDYIKILYKRWWLILIITIISMLQTGISSLRQPKIYEATATFFPLSTDYDIPSEGFIAKPRVNIENLIISLFESRKMADRIIEELNLEKVWNTESMSSLRGILRAATSITLQKNGLIKLSVRTTSTELAAEIANAYVDNLDYFNQQLEIGAQRQIVQVIDRAVVPDRRLPRDTVKKTMRTGLISFLFAIFLVFFVEFIQKSNIIKRLKEK